MPVGYSEPYQTYKMECFAKKVNTKRLFLQNNSSEMFDRFLNTFMDAEICFFTYF